jgi:site-specific DNA-methyltransferase (adenine-specific)
MATLDDNSIDAIVCDPPYELGFMGKAWDNSGIAYDVTVWQQCLRVLKPGGHLVAFGGSRTYHRLAVAIEDAGFEIRDQIQWIYGSGFPKSLDVSKTMDKQAGATREVVTEVREDMFGEYEKVNRYKAATQTGVMSGLNGSTANEQGHTYATITAPSTDLAKQWQGWGTALKPAHEPAVLARKPLCGTVADNVMTWGVGALNIDGTRIPSDDGFEKAWDKPVRTNIANGSAAFDTNTSSARGTHQVDISANKPIGGRWPANVILDKDAATALDAQSGEVQYKPRGPNKRDFKGWNYAGELQERHSYNYPGTGGASRFFYTAKASKSEREAGFNASIGERANIHPTVKPLALMRYLVRLVTPKGGKVLDPFMGSGSTGCASILEGFDFVGIDITPEYVAIAQKRIDHYAVTSPLEGF